jgi:hypothetical protein
MQWVATFDVDEMLTSTFRPRLDVGFRPTPLMNWFDSRRQQQQSVVVVSRFNFGPSNRTDPPPAPLGQGDWFTERILEDHAVAMSGPKSIGRIGFMTFERLWAHHWLDPIDGWSVASSAQCSLVLMLALGLVSKQMASKPSSSTRPYLYRNQYIS